jgi:hypothetical protein
MGDLVAESETVGTGGLRIDDVVSRAKRNQRTQIYLFYTSGSFMFIDTLVITAGDKEITPFYLR